MGNIKYVDLKNQREKLSDMIPLKMPFTLFIDPTNWCNFHCAFCPRNFDDFSAFAGPLQHMGLDLFHKIMNDLKCFGGKLKVLRLFYLGEPLLCPDFFAMLRLAIQSDVAERIEISTNASLLDQSAAKQIIDCAGDFNGVIYLRFSIYSVREIRHREITKSPLSIRHIYNNILKFKEIRDSAGRENVRTYAKMLETFDEETEEFIKLYRDVVDEVEIEEPMNWSGYEGRNLLTSYGEKLLEVVNRQAMPKVCAYPFHTMAIQSDGDVVCCCVDWSRQTVIGNVKEKSLPEIWNGKKMKNLRLLHLSGQRFLNEACKNCRKLPCGEAYQLDNLDDVSSLVLE